LRGYAYENLDRYDEAIEDFTKVIELYPDKPDGYTSRAGAYYNINKYEIALKDVNIGIKLDPDGT
jgi:tetratricopeptide (TPR) repeat protein